jgi:hypothetical protein
MFSMAQTQEIYAHLLVCVDAAISLLLRQELADAEFIIPLFGKLQHRELLLQIESWVRMRRDRIKRREPVSSDP